MKDVSADDRIAGEAPVPQAARAASREAKRRLRMSHGLYMLLLGLLSLTVGAAWILAEDGSVWFNALAALIIGAATLLAPALTRRIRAHQGVDVVGKGDLLPGPGRRENLRLPRRLAIGTGIAVGLGATLLFALPVAIGRGADVAGVVTRTIFPAILCLLGLVPLWSFVRLGLWEELVLAAGAIAAGTTAALGHPWGWSMAILGGSGLAAGISYHARWRRWVRQLRQV